jgi:radical SAM superfamily enzyme YgiQ (UPF0313 family)
MLTLVESNYMNGISDRPNLGCAMLIAACQEKGIKTTLVNGQTRYLRDIFVNDSNELWGLIQDLKKDDLIKLGVVEFKRSVQEKGEKYFRAKLNNLYQDVIVDKNPRQYFNAALVKEMNHLHNIFLSIYFYYLKDLNHSKLMIIERCVSEIINSGHRYVGFSMSGEFDLLSRTIRKRIKELTDKPIIVGGPLTTFIDLKNLDMIFRDECFDYLVIGAGEQALPSLINSLKNNIEPKDIMNVFYKKGNKIKGNDLGVIDDLNCLPYPDFSQFDLDLYLTPKIILPLQTARGCSWKKCTFCSHHNTYFGTYKILSIENVIRVIEHLKKYYNCNHFVFHDEELPPTRAKQIGKAILKNNLKNISIYAYARFIKGFNDNELLSCLRKAGFSTFAWGMESGSQRVLNLMNKGSDISIINQILKKSSANGIVNICFILFGFPCETKKEMQQTVEYIKKNANYIDDIILEFFQLYRDSLLWHNPAKWHLDIKENGSYLTKRGLSPKEAMAFFDKFTRKFEINGISAYSNKFKYRMPGNNRRMLSFLSSSYGLLSRSILLKYLKKGELNSIFPIILGDIKNEKDRTIFSPVNISETIYINQNLPEEKIVLDSLEKEIFILSAGKLSIDDIILAISNKFKQANKEEDIYERCNQFLCRVISRNWALGFAKSWGM